MVKLMKAMTMSDDWQRVVGEAGSSRNADQALWCLLWFAQNAVTSSSLTQQLSPKKWNEAN
jgi:hypothetical protein